MTMSGQVKNNAKRLSSSSQMLNALKRHPSKSSKKIDIQPERENFEHQSDVLASSPSASLQTGNQTQKSAAKNESQETVHSSDCLITVEFIENLSTEKIVNEVSRLSNPQVIIWYIGCSGLRKSSAHYYRDYLISPILNLNNRAIFWLVDLTAWNVFRTSSASINQSSSCCDRIENSPINRIKCIRSSLVFKKIQEVSDPEIISYFKKALRRNFIIKTSKDFQKKNILVRDIWSENCPIAADWYNYDVGKTYSLFQYLEGCILIDEIISQVNNTECQENLQIVFVLPNDENKYYEDQSSSFKKDIEFLISRHRKKTNSKKLKLEVKFLAFKYGISLNDRPYNSGGEVLKKNKFSLGDVYLKNEKGFYANK